MRCCVHVAAEVQYKDVTVPAVLGDVIKYMSDVERYREELRTLGGQWDF